MYKDELVWPHHWRDHDFREIVRYTIRNTVLKKEYYDLWKHEPKYSLIPLFIISILPQGQKTGWCTAKVQLFSEWYKLNYYLYTKYIDAHMRYLQKNNLFIKYCWYISQMEYMKVEKSVA